MLRAVTNIRSGRFTLRSVSKLQAEFRLTKRMQSLSLNRSGFAQSALVSLATSAAFALLGLVLAYWIWVWLAPRPEPRAPAAQGALQAGGPVEAAYGLFGSAQRNGGAAT